MKLFSRLKLNTKHYDLHEKRRKTDRAYEKYPLTNFLPERLLALHEQLPLLALGNVISMCLAYFFLADTKITQVVYLVILFNFLTTLWLLEYERVVTAKDLQQHDVFSSTAYLKKWHLRYLVCLAIIGLMWGIFAILFIGPIQGNFFDLTYQVNPFALFISSMVALFGLALSLSILPSVFVSFALCTMLPFIAVLLLHPSPNYNWLGFTAILFLLSAFALAWLSYRKIIDNLLQQQQNLIIQEKLKAETQALSKAYTDKSRFLANASHDLRQPLHTSILLLGILEEELTTKSQKDQLENLKKAIGGQTKLLSSLLNVSQLDSGTIQVNREHVELNDVFMAMENEFAPQATKQNRQLIIETTKLVVITDKLLLQRVLRNLLTNAFKHTQACPITLGVIHQQFHAKVFVKDLGLGISQQSLDNLYTTKGGGLGLSIIKRLCLLLEHPLEMESSNNTGTCFSVSVPYGQANMVKPIKAEAMLSPIGSFAGRHIMVIDDEKGTIDAMRIVVERWACEFSYAYSVEEALTLINSGTKPDIVISDYLLPNNKTGLGCIKAIRSVIGKDIPALVISGNTDPKILKLVTTEELHFLNKPVNLAKLRIAVTHLLKT